MAGFWRRVGEFFRAPTVTFAADESEPRPIDRMFAEMMAATVPTRIGRAEAMGVPAVQRGRNLICSISTLPLAQYDARNRLVASALLEQIDPDVANVVTIAQTVEDLLFEGLAWWEIISLGRDGFPSKAKHRDVGSVSLQPPASGKTPSPLPGEYDPRGAVVYVDGREVPASMMIRFDSPNPGLLKVAGRPIRRALLLDAAAAMYADEPRPMDYFSPVEGGDPATDDEIQQILDEWKASRKKRSTGYVPASLKYNTVEQPSPRDLQLVELQKRAVLDIANALGLDPEDLGLSTTSRTYQNAIDRRQDRINDVLSPYMRAITDRLSMGDVTRRGHLVRFDVDDYLRADPLTRWEVYEIGQRIGAIEVDEIRSEERLPARPAARPSRPAAAPTRAAAQPAYDLAAGVFGPSIKLADDGPAMTFAGFDFAGAVEPPKVDVEQRTITGLAVPYNKVARKYGMGFRFLPGSLQYTDVSRIKHLKDHYTPVGVTQSVEETKAGPIVKLSVLGGPEGSVTRAERDQLLYDAEHGLYDGLSVGVNFSLDPEVGDVEWNEKDKVYDVKRADWRETSSTPMPAFDDARVTKVAASRTEGNPMEDCPTCGQRHAPEVACQSTTPAPATVQAAAATPAPAAVPAAAPLTAAAAPASPTFSAEHLSAILGAIQNNGSIGIQPPAPAPEPALTPEPRAVVNPTRLTASVSEPAPYRFDREGNLKPGSHDFSTDLINGLRNGDRVAYERAMDFVRVQLDATSTTDTGALNPSRQRPDMYVDQREFRYPVWEAINKGTLTDVTPFVFPKFNSASGLVANHTEGTEPTVGDFTATSQTVTPTAVSGKAEINREVWDQGGNPQVSNLIWRQMTRGWYEALEAAAVALLDAATPTALGTFTAGGGTTGQTLAAELRASLAKLHFVRGGFRFTDGFAQVDLYTALTGALDDAGRPLFPAVGPSNADGTVSGRYQSVNVNGVEFLPAWALAASGAVAASSYLFDREDVHGWASAPQRLDFNYQVKSVFIGIWGYKATAISDINGVREISYDPVA